jgi:hypothetical protein
MEYAGYVGPAGYDSVVFRGDPSIVDGKAPEFLVFWIKGGRVLAGMNVNIWDINDDIKAVVQAGYAGKQVDLAQLADPSVPLGELIALRFWAGRGQYSWGMPRPTPQLWWNAMSNADRAAFMDQVAVGRRVSLDLWMKMRSAEVLAAPNGYANHPWEYYLPGDHLRFVLARAADRATGTPSEAAEP